MPRADLWIMLAMLSGAGWWLALAWWRGILKTPPDPDDTYKRLRLLDGVEVDL